MHEKFESSNLIIATMNFTSNQFCQYNPYKNYYKIQNRILYRILIVCQFLQLRFSLHLLFYHSNVCRRAINFAHINFFLLKI